MDSQGNHKGKERGRGGWSQRRCVDQSQGQSDAGPGVNERGEWPQDTRKPKEMGSLQVPPEGTQHILASDLLTPKRINLYCFKPKVCSDSLQRPQDTHTAEPAGGQGLDRRPPAGNTPAASMPSCRPWPCPALSQGQPHGTCSPMPGFCWPRALPTPS